MNDVKINISSTGFPSQFVSDAEKATDEFGNIGTGVQSRFKYDKSPSTANSFLYFPTDCSPRAYSLSL